MTWRRPSSLTPEHTQYVNKPMPGRYSMCLDDALDYHYIIGAEWSDELPNRRGCLAVLVAMLNNGAFHPGSYYRKYYPGAPSLRKISVTHFKITHPLISAIRVSELQISLALTITVHCEKVLESKPLCRNSQASVYARCILPRSTDHPINIQTIRILSWFDFIEFINILQSHFNDIKALFQCQKKTTL